MHRIGSWQWQCIARFSHSATGNSDGALRATIQSTHPWLTMQTTGSTALSPSNSPPTQISTHGEFNSPRGCRVTFGSVGTAEATRIEADFTGTDCQLATFTGRVVLTKG
jgi:hypothetical protein